MVKLAVIGEGARTPGRTNRGAALRAALLPVLVTLALPAGAAAEQASQPSSPAAGELDAGGQHSCALSVGDVRCLGNGFSGQLGYGNKSNIGDNETPGFGPVNLGAGRTAKAISAGDFHTCALLDDGSVRCWGFGGDGRLGYGNENDVGDNESPGSVGPVNLGGKATAISAGGAHTCAVLEDKSLRCWGFGEDGRLGYATENAEGVSETVGDDETPGSAGPVDVGGPATAISVGAEHTCALLEDRSVRCWGDPGGFTGGDGGDGRLGYANANFIGDDETPGSAGPVDVGGTAAAISAGDWHTCAVLDGGAVRCWGLGVDGRLGYGNEFAVGDNETPGSKGPVELGGTATAVSAGNHTCARLDNGTVRCWGPGRLGQLGYGDTEDIGDNETPGSVPVPVNLGGTAAAISAGDSHTCARLDDTSLRCWGEGDFGRLGYGNQNDVGDNETPAAAGPVDFRPRASVDDRSVIEGSSGERTVTFTVRLSTSSRETTSVAYATANESAVAPADYTARSGRLTFAPGERSKTFTVGVKGDTLDEPNERFVVNLSSPTNLIIADPRGTGTIADDDTPPAKPVSPAKPFDAEAAALRAQESRRRGLRSCLSKARRHTRRETGRARRLKGSRRARARRHARGHESRLRRACLKRWGRTPGRVTGLNARALSARTIVLTFKASGTHGNRSPAARTYLVKQSRRPIRGARGFRRAKSLCRGVCRFRPSRVGATLTLRVTRLRPRATYHYSIVARDNVSRRLGPRSRAARARTR